MDLHYVTGIVDVTAHSISVFQEDELPKILMAFSYLTVILA